MITTGRMEVGERRLHARFALRLERRSAQLLPGLAEVGARPILNWGSPLIADLDIRTADLEVVVWSANGGRLFAWHHNGVELVDGDQNPATDGVLARITGDSFNYGSAAVAQLDADPAARDPGAGEQRRRQHRRNLRLQHRRHARCPAGRSSPATPRQHLGDQLVAGGGGPRQERDR